MIISCTNCSKKFNVDANLIPEKGRMVQCSTCDHKWFFRIKKETNFIKQVKNDTLDVFEKNNDKKFTVFDKDKNTNHKNNPPLSKITDVVAVEKIKNKRNILNFTVVFIISFVALIIILDTFKSPVSKIIPNIEFLLYNLYESIKDIILFIRDLV